jgi:hypothetical protein
MSEVTYEEMVAAEYAPISKKKKKGEKKCHT